jgi:hypothetical protein
VLRVAIATLDGHWMANILDADLIDSQAARILAALNVDYGSGDWRHDDHSSV